MSVTNGIENLNKLTSLIVSKTSGYAAKAIMLQIYVPNTLHQEHKSVIIIYFAGYSDFFDTIKLVNLLNSQHHLLRTQTVLALSPRYVTGIGLHTSHQTERDTVQFAAFVLLHVSEHCLFTLKFVPTVEKQNGSVRYLLFNIYGYYAQYSTFTVNM